MFKKKKEQLRMEKFIDIEAGMEGDIKFNSPIDLKLNGKFTGKLETMGNLFIGEKGNIKAKIIKGENIVIAGKVEGCVVSTKCIELFGTAKMTGDIKSPILVVNEGAMLKGYCQVPIEHQIIKSKESAKSRKRKKK